MECTRWRDQKTPIAGRQEEVKDFKIPKKEAEAAAQEQIITKKAYWKQNMEEKEEEEKRKYETYKILKGNLRNIYFLKVTYVHSTMICNLK